MLAYILSFLGYWAGKVITLILNIIPIGWILRILHLFHIDFSLDNSFDLFLMFFVGLLSFVIIGKILIDRIIQILFRSESGIGAVGIFLKWLVGLVDFRKFLEIFKIRKNIGVYLLSLFLILLIYTLSYNGITTFSDLVDYAFNKTHSNNILSGNITEQSNNLSGNTQIVLSGQIQTGNVVLSKQKLTKEIGSGVLNFIYQAKHGFNKSLPKMKTIDTNALLLSGKTEELNVKERYQKYFFLITLNWNKKPDYTKSYYLMGLPLEPISFYTPTNLLYLIFLTAIIFIFWLIIIAVSPLTDLLLILFLKKTIDYLDMISFLIRLVFAILLWYLFFSI